MMMYTKLLFTSFLFHVVLTEETTGFPDHLDYLACENDFDCIDVNSYFCKENICTCKEVMCVETIMMNDGVAITKIGEMCERFDRCLIENSSCISERCECQKGYISSPSKDKCLPIVKEPGSQCTESVQCWSERSKGVCKNGTCNFCKDDEHIVEKNCYKNRGLAEACENNEECLVTNFSVCKNGSCSCIDRYVSNGSRCLLIALGQHSPCEEDVQCVRALGDGSECYQSKCRCATNYKFKPDVNKCISNSITSHATLNLRIMPYISCSFAVSLILLF